MLLAGYTRGEKGYDSPDGGGIVFPRKDQQSVFLSPHFEKDCLDVNYSQRRHRTYLRNIALFISMTMMSLLLFLSCFVLFIGIVLLFVLQAVERRTRIPRGNVVYSDTNAKPGQILRSTTLPLSGKPDYLIKKGKYIIPIEKKTGKTPSQPYANHIAQLYAYCLLVKENFNIRPPYGIIDYPDQDFELEFDQSAEENLKIVINEMLEVKNTKLHRGSLTHLCKSCRQHPGR